MVTFIDNLAQVLVLVVCLILSLRRLVSLLIAYGSPDHSDQAVVTEAPGASRSKDFLRAWFMIACFFSCQVLALGYWWLHMIEFGFMPRFFYVADLGWSASFVFMMMLEVTCDTWRTPQAPVSWAWLVPVAAVPQYVLYLTHGDVLNNTVQCALVAAIGYFAVRGLFGRSLPGFASNRAFHGAVLFYAASEYFTWTASCFWSGATFDPYIVSDICLTLSFAAMLVAAWSVRP